MQCPLHAQICGKDQHWVKAHFRRGYYRSDGIFVKATNVTAHCQGNPEGYAYWGPKLKDDRPQWPHRFEKSKKWTIEEKERVLEALAELPEVLWGNTIEGIYRMDKSQTSVNNPATSAAGAIVLYDSAFSKPNKTQPLARIIGHELAHEYYRKKLSDADLADYHTLASWESSTNPDTGEVRWTSPRTNFVKNDGRISPEEDFANNIEYFLFEPAKLKYITPNAYDWIIHHFGGKLKLRKGK
jgi:hypothetical protein